MRRCRTPRPQYESGRAARGSTYRDAHDGWAAPMTARKNERRWADIGAAASYAGASTTTVRRWISNGDLASYSRPPTRGRGERLSVVVDLNDIDALMEPVA